MKRQSMTWMSGGLAALLLGSVAFAEPAGSTEEPAPPAAGQQEQQTGQQDPQSGQQDPQSGQDEGTGSSNSATPANPGVSPATPSPNASPKATQTPSRTGKKMKNKRSKRALRLRAPKMRLSKKRAGRVREGAADLLRNRSTNGQTGAQESLNGREGSRPGSGSAVQGNLPKQQGNQTENNQNNSMKNINTNLVGAQAFMGLVNVNVSNVSLNIYKVIDVHNVLNNSQVEILTQKIQNSPGAQAKQEILNNLLREAEVIKDNQVVVGVLSSMKRILVKSKPSGSKPAGSPSSGSGSSAPQQ